MKICGSKEDVESPVQGDWKCGQGTAGHRGTGRKVCYWASAWHRYWRHLPLHTYSPAQFRTGPGPGHIDVSRTADRGGHKNEGLCHLGKTSFLTHFVGACQCWGHVRKGNHKRILFYRTTPGTSRTHPKDTIWGYRDWDFDLWGLFVKDAVEELNWNLRGRSGLGK